MKTTTKILGTLKKVSIENKWNVPNQFVITIETPDGRARVFQSYSSTIAIIDNHGSVTIGRDWDYSKTTGKYRNLFLGEDKKTTEAKIKSGEYAYDETI